MAIPGNGQPGTCGGLGGARLSLATIAKLWVDAGGPPAWAWTMAGIAYAESGGYYRCVQQGQAYSTTGWGLWQITPGNSEPQCGSDEALLSPRANACAAVAKFRGQGIGAWQGDPVGDGALNSGSKPLSKSDVLKILGGAGIPSSGGVSSFGSFTSGSSTSPGCCGHKDPHPGTAASCKPWTFPHTSFGFTYCQYKALAGGAFVAIGGSVAVLGAALLIIAGMGSREGQIVQAATSVVGGARKLGVPVQKLRGKRTDENKELAG